MATNNKKQLGVWIPDEILGMDLPWREKVLLAYFHGFDEKGCYQSNRQIGNRMNVNRYQLIRGIKKLDGKGYLHITNPGNSWRNIWTKPNYEAKNPGVLQERNSTGISGQNQGVECHEPVADVQHTCCASATDLLQMRNGSIIVNNKEDNKPASSPSPALGQTQPPSQKKQSGREIFAAEMAAAKEKYIKAPTGKGNKKPAPKKPKGKARLSFAGTVKEAS